MSVTIPVFWGLLTESRLLAPEQIQQQQVDFGQMRGAGEATAKTLSEWLVARNVLSKYQTTILLAGRAGPFFYGEYKVYDRVDKGRLAGQFRAVHSPTGHPVLLQFVTGPLLSDPYQWAAAANETWTASRIVSLHVQRFFEPVDLQSFKFLVGEDLRGATLDDRLAVGRFPPAEACRIIRLVALGLAQLHQGGRAHGDVRPANILLESIPNHPGNAKLLLEPHLSPQPVDFSQPGAGSKLEKQADYLAPELLAPGRAPDAQSDLYALGCTLYTMLAGSVPFAGGDVQSKLARHASEPIRPLEQFGVPQPLAQLVTYLLAKNPAVRYQSAAIVAEQIAAFVDPNVLYAQPPSPPATLTGFEHSLRQKQAAMNHPAMAPVSLPHPAMQSAPQETGGFPNIVTTGNRAKAQPDFSALVQPAASAPEPSGFALNLRTEGVPAPQAANPFAAAPATGFPAQQFPGPGAVAPATASPLALPGLSTTATPAKVAVVAPVAKPNVVTERLRRQKEQQQQRLIGGIVGAGVLALAVVVGILLMNIYGKQEAEELAANQPEDPATEVETAAGPQGAGTNTATNLAQAATGTSTGAANGQVTNTGAATTGNAGSVPTPPTPGTATPGTAAPETATTSTTPVTSTPGSGAPATGAVKPPAAGEAGLTQEVVPDDGKLLWAAPTAGKPISFRCVPPEAQVFLAMRPADILASGEGERVLLALGPSFAARRAALEAASGCKFEEIEQLIVSLHNNDAKFPRTSFVVTLKDKLPIDELVAKWGNPAATEDEKGKYYGGPTWSYYQSPKPEDERTFLMAGAADVKEVVKAGGNPPVLFREMERLRRTTDSQRHVTVLFYPQFLFNDDGEPLFAGDFAKTRQPLSWLLGDHLQAASAGIHLGEDVYFELRMLGSLDKEPYKLAEELASRLDQVPTSLEDYFVALTPPAYWKKLAFRYPGMIRELHNNLRIGVENDQAVVNSVLPTTAAHNLVLGGELLVSSAPGAGGAVTTGGPTKPMPPQTIEEALQLKTSYTFDQQSLEFAMRDLATDVKDLSKGAPFEFEIKIIGADLEKDGITRNQSVRDFKQEGQSVADILTALCRKANPVTTVKDPSETDQKLVWVIGPDPENAGKTIVLITTRTAAAAKKYTLPAPFVPKNA